MVKNLLVGEDLTYERKMREMILTARVERLLSKAEILELYLNSTYLGRGSWGVEMAARSYFGKSVKALSLGEGALLAALTKGPNYFNPDQHPERAQERLAYVLGRHAGGWRHQRSRAQGRPRNPAAGLVAYVNPRRDTGFHFVDNLAREAKAVAGIDALTADSYTVRSTIQPDLQRATEAALQEGLARFEIDGGRVSVPGARGQSRRCRQRRIAARRPQNRRAARSRPGSRRSRRRGCRSTTCTGRWRWWSTRAAARAGHHQGRAGGRPHPAAVGRRRLDLAQSQAL